MVVGANPGEKILELGTGTRRYFQYPQSIAIDKSSHAKCDIVRNVAHRGIPFADNTFDKVLSMDVIEHIEMYDDLIFFVNEIWRVLKNGGIWYFTTPSGLSGYEHSTHHRVFFPGGFYYFSKPPDETWEHMRIADGIVAMFDLNIVPEESGRVIQGEFRAIK
ncbi:MAG: class I SAM-dependent methyltransferase [Sulfurovaceae bacterium]|nr:class I SAM-dependent methyltransferase [Sulfurovaceae bacterium]